MKKHAAKLANTLAPGVLQNIARIDQIDSNLKDLQTSVAMLQEQFSQSLESPGSRLTKLRLLAEQVEPYQPAYGIEGIITGPERSSIERARVIEDWLQPVAGLRMLDIGSSLGYFSFYFADRGAGVEAWDSNAQNIEVAQGIADFNGINVSFKVKEFNADTVKTIPNNCFDVALVLSVFHHIIYFNGLEYTQKLVQKLFEKCPVLIVELARKGEDKKLPWDKAQPADELAIFELVKDRISIRKIGDFSNHLSHKTRPMYVIENKKQVKVNNHRYIYTRVSKQAYKNSPVAHTAIGRKYYFGPNFVIKEYSLDAKSRGENLGQILNSIKVLHRIREQELKVFHAPKLLDFKIDYPAYACVVLARTEGLLISDLLTPAKLSVVLKVTKDILRTLIDLEKYGYHHNDIRSWNVIVDSKNRGWLIDYGLVDTMALEDDIVALAWVVYALLTNEREASGACKKTLPPREPFSASSKLLALYQAIESGERSLRHLHKLLS